MSNYVYETHIVDPLLPFIIHTDTVKAYPLDRPNWHRNLEILCCISGRGEIKLNSECCLMEPGDVVVINSDVIHGTQAEEQVIYHCLIIDNSFLKANGLDGEKLHFQHLFRDREITQAMERIAKEYACYKVCKELTHVLKIRRDVLGILCVLYSRYRMELSGEENIQTTQRVKAVVTFVRQNLGVPISLDMLAEHTGVSKFHLSREFKSTTGLTIVTFINLCRCTEARRLLEEGMTVSEAAMTCGFENMSYFTRTFKRLLGVLPSEVQNK